MAMTHLKPGEIVDVQPLRDAIATAKTTTLTKTNRLELIRLVLPAGKEISEHKTSGEIIVHCLEGRVSFSIEGKAKDLSAGQLLYLSAGIPHSVKAVEDSSLLLTILLLGKTRQPEKDIVQEASEESFPASDPPARSPIVSS